MAAWVLCSRSRASGYDLPWGSSRKGNFTSLLSCIYIVLISLLASFFYSFSTHNWMRSFVLFHFGDYNKTLAVAAGSKSCVVFASAAATTEQPDGQNKDSPQSVQTEQRAQEGEKEKPHSKKHENVEQKSPLPPRPALLRFDSTGPVGDYIRSPYSVAFHSRTPDVSLFRGSRDAGSSSPSARAEDRSRSSSEAGGWRCSTHRSEVPRSVGCETHPRVNPFPLFNRMPSIGDGSACATATEGDYGAPYGSDDEFRAASEDESAVSALCAKSLESLSLSRSKVEGCESCSAAALPTSFSAITRTRPRRRHYWSAPGGAFRAESRKQDFKRRRSRRSRASGSLDRMEFQEGAVLVDKVDTEDGRPPTYTKKVPTAFHPSTEDGDGLDDDDDDDDDDADDDDDEVDGMGAEPGPVPMPGVTERTFTGGRSAEDSSELDLLMEYESNRASFKAEAQVYEDAVNNYYGLNEIPFTAHPSACAKANISTLLTHVRSETSILFGPSLRVLMHLVVRVLSRGVQVVAACYPHYSYVLGRNAKTVVRLPHFVRIFEESLEVIASDPRASTTTRREQLDMAYKVQSAASQGEAALGAVQSIVLSGLTTTPSTHVNLLKVQDLLSDIDMVPALTKRLLLMLAELCRAAYEMSEPEAQPFLCPDEADRTDTVRKPGPAEEESIAYCRGETQKFVRVFNEAQSTAKKIAEHALQLYGKLVVLELIP